MNKQEIKDFFDDLAAKWDEELDVNEDKIDKILDAAGIQPDVRVLDVACGTGILFPFYKKRKVAGVTGVDISTEMTKIAKRKIADSSWKVICGDIESIQAKKEYDCCVIYNAFPHFPNPENLLKCLTKWLKPNGRLTVAHGMSVETLNKHHMGHAASVSREMSSLEEMVELFGRFFTVDFAVSDDEKFILSGTCKCLEMDE